MASLPHPIDEVKSKGKAISIAIIGGGIGGLCLALGLLKQSNLDVQVYEAAPTFSEIGAGVALGYNARTALELLGPVAKEALQKNVTGNQWSSHSSTFEDFRVGAGKQEGATITVQKDTDGFQSVYRAHFLDELVKGVPAQRAHFNKRLENLEENDGNVTLYFKDGTTATADVAIGTDGIHSKVREHLIGAEAAKSVFAGSVVFRDLIPMTKAVEMLGSEHAQNARLLCGPGRACLTFPIDFGKTLHVAIYEMGHKEWPHEKWIVPANHAKLTNSFANWGKPGQGLVKLLNPDMLTAWGIFDSAPASFYNKGHIAMMGDAAHASTPSQGAGAGQAIEDACVLSALFEKVTTPKEIANALAAYDQIRRPRAQRVVTTSRENGQLVTMGLPGVGDDIEKMREALETRMHWIWHRDLVAQNEAAVKLFEEAA